MNDSGINRRDGSGLAGFAIGAAAAVPLLATGAAPDFVTRVDFKASKWNRDIYARMDGNLDATNVRTDKPAPVPPGWNPPQPPAAKPR